MFSFQLLINVMDIMDYDQIKITPSINYMDWEEGGGETNPQGITDTQL